MLRQAESMERTPDTEQSDDIDDYGRRRPEIFSSFAKELGLCFAIMSSQVMAEYFISGFNVIVPTLTKDLSIPIAESIWPASAFALTAGSSLLIFGRLADIYGGYVVFIGGLVWSFIWSLVAGFSQNRLMLIFARALQGFGPAAFLSSGVMILGSSYRPGPRKNLVFSIYGGCAPVGFFSGIFFSGLSAQYLNWRWYFWIGTILTGVSLLLGLFFIQSDFHARQKANSMAEVKMDWAGGVFLFSGLILVVFAVNDGAHAPQNWGTSYIIVCFIVGIFVLGVTVYTEGWYAEQPLLPSSLFKVPQMKALITALFFSYGVLGTWLLYTTFYTSSIMGVRPMQLVAWFLPFAIGGLVLSAFGGLILHKAPGKVFLAISGAAWVLAPLLLAIAPPGASYWAFIFPAMICGTIGIDITYNVANVFITTKLAEREQGLAGAVCNSILFLGVSFFLGFADLTAQQTEAYGLRKSYQAVFWYAVCCAAVALVLILTFVNVEAARTEERADDQLESGSIRES
ncbi:MFS general substrate transporter [Pseudovirgaria hyperparasitica]|uniref:MFS general substrate transporter n=1 Tax=Pseudovirgaria hyperparasitica TaxID=470096 RepID=A0A6A6WM89_9PEZI|nr:MFS general substrate transporter [Pseudovirgaria hyperparasitica]KAF2763337.1 MFS general substrate transporter [Pseudovirgaria hyperparasitica]